MSVTWDKAKEIMEKSYPDSIVNSVMDIPTGYVVNIQPKDWNPNNVVLDGFFKVDKRSGKISEYSPVIDTKEFRYALEHSVYTRQAK